MNCSDGRQLMGRLREDGRLDDDQRRDLVEHFSDCPDCRRDGLAADPTLLFLGASPLELERSEVASIRRTVRAMQRARDLDAAGSRSWTHVLRAAAAAILLTALLLLPGGQKRLAVPSPEPDTLSGGPLHAGGEDLAPVSVWESPSLIENLDRPEARIYQLTEQDLSIVMIVDESLDL